MPKVSVVIPVYNPGEGISRCISSLRRQTLSDIEMIFIDDCGNDDSMRIVESAAENDDRISIIHNESNIGAGRSRNKGIQAATGEYLSFVDPDDYTDERFLEQLYTSAKNSNSDIAKGRKVSIGYDSISGLSPNAYNLNEEIRRCLDSNKPVLYCFTHEHWTAIYKRSYVIENNVLYGTSRCDQDTTFLQKACYFAKSITLVDSAIYYNVYRQDSAVRDFSSRRIGYLLHSLREQLGFLLTIENKDEDYSRFIIRKIQVRLDAISTLNSRFSLSSQNEKYIDELESILLALPFIDDLMSKSVTIKALVMEKTILGSSPYGIQWRTISFNEYLDLIRNWQSYLCDHPEEMRDSIVYLWPLYEKALNFNSWETTREKRKAISELYTISRRFPDVETLCGSFLSLRLFVKYGVNVFAMRDTAIGKLTRRLLSVYRSGTVQERA